MDEYLRAVSNILAVIVEEQSDGTVYIAESKATATDASDPVWRVRKISKETSGGVTRTTIAWAGGCAEFKFSANNMSSLTFANY